MQEDKKQGGYLTELLKSCKAAAAVARQDIEYNVPLHRNNEMHFTFRQE